MRIVRQIYSLINLFFSDHLLYYLVPFFIFPPLKVQFRCRFGSLRVPQRLNFPNDHFEIRYEFIYIEPCRNLRILRIILKSFPWMFIFKLEYLFFQKNMYFTFNMLPSKFFKLVFCFFRSIFRFSLKKIWEVWKVENNCRHYLEIDQNR